MHVKLLGFSGFPMVAELERRITPSVVAPENDQKCGQVAEVVGLHSMRDFADFKAFEFGNSFKPQGLFSRCS
jgi:hypothetical protein